MRPGIQSNYRPCSGYLIIEALVYISAVVVLLGVGLIAMHRAVDNSLVLRRNADDISHTTHIGELWRQDLRHAAKEVSVENGVEEQVLHLQGDSGTVEYLFTQGAIYRRVDLGPWSRVLEKVKASSMRLEPRSHVQAWVWDLELLPESRGSVRAARMRPLFSFIGVAPSSSNSQP